MAVSPGGTRVFVTGTSQGATSHYDYATVAYSTATGTRLWARRYNGPGNGDDHAWSVAVSPGGYPGVRDRQQPGRRLGL